MSRFLKLVIVFTTLILAIIAFVFISNNKKSSSPITNPKTETVQEAHPMSIESLKKRTYKASDIVIEETLPSEINYKKFIASYKSDNLKIYGLLTIPNIEKPETGFPVIIFLHGYVPPKQYSTTGSYVASQDGLARNEFITFKPDLRGHGNSEGQAEGAHFSEAYVVDTLNLISALKNYIEADPNKIGIWGHSNGGEIALRLMVITKDLKAAVIWAGVVGSFQDMLETYRGKIPFMRRTSPLVEKYGSPSANPEFWSKIDPYYFIKDISTPIQLHQGTADPQVPVELSRHLKQELEKNSKSIEYFEYEGADHNFTGPVFNQVMKQSIDFFRKHL